MSEATGWEAKTIHRLLEYSPKKGGFKKDQDDPLDADVLIIDETSMVDTLLMYHLLKAIPHQAHLILVGDVDQLPSVGPGNVLRDIIDSGAVTGGAVNRDLSPGPEEHDRGECPPDQRGRVPHS